MNKLYEIFSVPVYEFELEVNNEELKTFIERFKKLPDRSATKSNVGGFQSIDLPLDTTEVMHLVNVIERTINDDREFDSKFYQIVFNIWFNINKKNDSNASHLHPFSVYSGVYYVKTPENCGTIIFEHPAMDLLHYYNNAKEGWHFLPAIENTLYIFPSWLKHFVQANENKEEERISISFNTSNGV